MSRHTSSPGRVCVLNPHRCAAHISLARLTSPPHPLTSPNQTPQPEPCWGPEAVCLAQLEALQAGDAAGVFRFASPANQAATGPVERFALLLQVRSRCRLHSFGGALTSSMS